jgi:transporter family-2 protein
VILLILSGDLFFLAVAVAAGIAMAVQGSMNSAVSKAIGLYEATFYVHFSAALTMILLFLLGFGKGNFENFKAVPLYYYLGGVIGVIITFGVVLSIPKLGAAVATTSIIVGQVLSACAIDHFGLFGLEKSSFTWMKLLGLLLLSAGAKILLSR